MNFLHHTDARIQQLTISATSSFENGEAAEVTSIDLSDNRLHESLLQYFLNAFREPSFYQFRTGEEQTNNNLIQGVFNDPSNLTNSLRPLLERIADHQHEENTPRSFIITAYLSNVILEDEVLDAVAVFVTEDHPKFILFDDTEAAMALSLVKGIHQDKSHQGCLIFNTDNGTGYKICAKDKSKPFQTLTPWMTEIMQLQSKTNAYLDTKETIKLTKQFIKDQVKEVPDLDKTYEAEVMNKSLQYFQEQSDFSQEEYAAKVFKNPEIESEFNAYRDAYQESSPRKLSDNFSVNLDAVKNQSKVFKSVLKLDKNFHVYIHGNRNMIEKGTDDEGRKFYKLFFDEEK